MGRIGIITFHFVNNYGGVLQAYALQKVISDLGHKVYVIDYRNWFIRFTDAVRMMPVTKRLDVFKAGMKSYGDRKGRVAKINRFIQGHLNLTKRVSYRELYTLDSDFDKFICGSDQIWNPLITGGVDKAYYLDFINDKTKKISYAPSMGTGRIFGFHLKKMFRMIKEIGYLSIREKSTRKMLFEAIGKSPEILVDPTFLIKLDEWETLADKPDGLPEKYILLYMMQGDERIYEYARRMKEVFNVPIVEISRYGYNPGFADYIKVNVGIEEFLGLFLNATYICTNSYHGFVYSLIFNKDLCLIPSVHFSARIRNLLELFEMSDADLSTKEKLLMEIDYNKADSIIRKQRNKALDYLSRAINE